MFSLPCFADTQVSVGATVLRAEAPSGDIMFIQPSNITRGSYWYEGVNYIGSISFKGVDTRANVAVRGGWMFNYKRLDIGVGIAALTQPRPFDNAGGLNFNPQAVIPHQYRLGYDVYTHYSDAGFRSPNVGRDVLLFGRRF